MRVEGDIEALPLGAVFKQVCTQNEAVSALSLTQSPSLSITLSPPPPPPPPPGFLVLTLSSLLPPCPISSHLISSHLISSLLSTQVIAKLSERKLSHVPYRDSKLTRLLQTSLGGNAQISVSE